MFDVLDMSVLVVGVKVLYARSLPEEEVGFRRPFEVGNLGFLVGFFLVSKEVDVVLFGAFVLCSFFLAVLLLTFFLCLVGVLTFSRVAVTLSFVRVLPTVLVVGLYFGVVVLRKVRFVGFVCKG